MKRSVTLLILCYNEEENLSNNKIKILSVLDKLNEEWKAIVLIEEDGSSDGTRDLINTWTKEDKRIRTRFADTRLGKGGGLVYGLGGVESDYVIMCDADIPIEPEDFRKMVKTLESGSDIVIANRKDPLTDANIPISRKTASWAFHILVYSLFQIPFRDTQSGIKAFKTDKLKSILPRIAKRYTMDVEILQRGIWREMKITEIPVHYIHGENECFNVATDSPSMLFELINLRWNLRRE